MTTDAPSAAELEANPIVQAAFVSAVVAIPTVSRRQAIAIAETDALPIYGAEWLNSLVLQIALHDDGWHVEYRQWRPRYTGGGPHYVIDATTDAIISK